MSVRAYSIGRNGMPERRSYAYGGSGKDTMPWAQLTSAEERAFAEQDAQREREAVSAQVTAARLRASHPAYEPPPVPSILNGLLVSPGEQLGHDLKRAKRCTMCHYMTGTPGHRLVCGEP